MKDRIKFYHSNKVQKNKLLVFKVNNRKDAIACLKRFQRKGSKIHAAWYYQADKDSGGFNGERLIIALL